MTSVLALTLWLTTSWLTMPQSDARRDVGRPIIENERVAVWDLSWEKGKTALAPGDDAVVVYLTPAADKGRAVFWPKGTPLPPAPAGARTIVIDLKDHRVSPLANASGYPNAFPRAGNIKVFDNAKVVVWDYTWMPAAPTPMHFHDKDVVVVYLEEGALRSTTPDGQSVVNDLTMGLTKFNPRDRVHTEELIRGRSRAIITELK